VTVRIYGRNFVSILLAGFVALLGGCQRPSGALQEVTGFVKFQGQPLDRGSIQFYADEGPTGPSGGAMIRQGKYQLPAEHGLKPGGYTVRVSSGAPSPEAGTSPDDPMRAEKPVNVERIPESFNTRSTVQVKVSRDAPNYFEVDIP
jgi:hypothetical protein